MDREEAEKLAAELETDLRKKGVWDILSEIRRPIGTDYIAIKSGDVFVVKRWDEQQ